MAKKRANIYSVDTSSLVHGWRRAYRPKNFAPVWERMEALMDEGRLLCSIEVLHDLKKKDDDLHEWCNGRKEKFCVEIDDACQAAVAEIMAAHERLVDTVTGRSGSDPFVIGLAKTIKPTMVVVTEEHQGKVRIPDVCDAQGIRCIRLADLIEEEDWKF
jgi:uncharacterized protein DUF4411